jgi:hypothetical protein
MVRTITLLFKNNPAWKDKNRLMDQAICAASWLLEEKDPTPSAQCGHNEGICFQQNKTNETVLILIVTAFL